jgi:hypothetical protein
MMHSRDALTKALQAQAAAHPTTFANHTLRSIFQVLLLVVSHEDQPVKSWDDVRGAVHEAVEAHLPPEMAKIGPAITKVLLNVVDDAVRLAPVYVTPPPY